MSSKPRILVITELFPTASDPVRGVFMLDHLRALSPYIDQHVMVPRLYTAGTKTDLLNGVASVEEVSAFEPGGIRWPKWIGYGKLFKKFNEHAQKKEPFDLVHAHGSAIAGTLAAQLSEKWGCPMVITEHTGPVRNLLDRPVIGKFARRSMKRADQILAVSEHQRNELVNCGVENSLIKVIPNPVETEKFKPPKSDNPRKQILFCGRLDENKGALRTVKAFHQMLDGLDGFRLLVCGSGKEEQALRKYVLNNSLQDVVLFKGMLKRSEFIFELSNSAVFVFPSIEETFGLTGAEAISCGVPVVITNTSGPRDYFFDGAGIQVDPNNIEHIGKAMVDLVDGSQPDREKLHARIKNHLGYDSFSGKMMDQYTTLLNR